MSNEIVVGWITLAGIVISSIAGIITAVITTNSRIKKEREQNRLDEALREQRQEIKFQEIDDKLKEHNGYAEKFADTHDEIIAIGRDVSWIKEEVRGLKEFHHGKK